MSNKKEIIQKKIVSILNSIRVIPKEKKKNLLDFNFIDNQHLDSFEILKFILTLEKYFKIKIDNFDPSKKKLQTINGFTSLILKKLSR